MTRALLPPRSQAPAPSDAAPVPFCSAPATSPAQLEAAVRDIAASSPEEWSAALSGALGVRATAAGSTLAQQSAELAAAVQQALGQQPAELVAALAAALGKPEAMAASLAEALEDPTLRSAFAVGGVAGLALVAAGAAARANAPLVWTDCGVAGWQQLPAGSRPKAQILIG